MAGRPELVQFADLTPAHFERHPVWLQCHGLITGHIDGFYSRAGLRGRIRIEVWRGAARGWRGS